MIDGEYLELRRCNGRKGSIQTRKLYIDSYTYKVLYAMYHYVITSRGPVAGWQWSRTVMSAYIIKNAKKFGVYPEKGEKFRKKRISSLLTYLFNNFFINGTDKIYCLAEEWAVHVQGGGSKSNVKLMDYFVKKVKIAAKLEKEALNDRLVEARAKASDTRKAAKKANAKAVPAHNQKLAAKKKKKKETVVKKKSQVLEVTWEMPVLPVRMSRDTVVLEVLTAIHLAGKVGHGTMPKVSLEAVMLELTTRSSCYPKAAASTKRRMARLLKKWPTSSEDRSWREVLVSAVGYLHANGIIEAYQRGQWVQLSSGIKIDGKPMSVWLLDEKHPVLDTPVPGIPAPKSEPEYKHKTPHVKVVTTLDSVSAFVGKTVLTAQAYPVEELVEAFSKLLTGMASDNAIIVGTSDGRLSISIPMKEDTPLIG